MPKIVDVKNIYKKIGFVPTEEFDDYKIEYKLYDLCEQNLIYHLYSRPEGGVSKASGLR